MEKVTPRLRAGDLVEVLSREQILATLDRQGALGAMPFMPEMLHFCGQRFRVSKVAHKTCDTAHRTGARTLQDCYHLEDLRCDGSVHGGCQATCLLFWKGAWLRKVEGSSHSQAPSVATAAPASVCTEQDLQAATRVPTEPGAPIRYSCQAIRLFEASGPLPWWSPGQYFRDVACGNWAFGPALRLMLASQLRALMRLPFAFGLWARLYIVGHRLLMGRRPVITLGGAVPKGAQTPVAQLGLKPGEWVRVRPYDEIRKTLNAENKNRGLWFDQEMAEACGEKHQVSGRVERILHETTGEMVEMKTPCIVLKGVNCTGRYVKDRMLCPRAVTTYWREGWLERDSTEKRA